jgi:hypothetical protein
MQDNIAFDTNNSIKEIICEKLKFLRGIKIMCIFIQTRGVEE